MVIPALAFASTGYCRNPECMMDWIPACAGVTEWGGVYR